MNQHSENFKSNRARKLELQLYAAMSAKILCSAVFVSGRDPEEATRNSVITPLWTRPGFQGQPEKVFSKIETDWDSKVVNVTLKDGPTSTAKYYGDQGCIILPRDASGVFFEPVKVETKLPDPMTQDWPMGDAQPDEALPPEVDEERLKGAVDAAFADSEAYTAAFLVVYKGRIIAERYGQGVDKDTQLESWSMGKSITSTLVGLLVQEGHLGLYDPAPVPEWQLKGDPRAEIRVADLLRMSSGLRFSYASDPKEKWEQGVPDHLYVYCGALDVFQFSVNKPPEHPPNTVGRYRNCDPLTLGYIVKRTVTAMGEEYLTWPQKALFDRIGIRRQVLETDPYGNFIMTGFDYGTARNWARIGLLHLWDGVWMGERLLPEGWVDFVSKPTPAWEEPEYGGLFWVNGTGRWSLPRNAFWASGAGGQHTFIVPSHDLVVVRMGHRRGGEVCEASTNEALSKLINAIDAEE
jgi:CubicO group peptidase (beta-lactamase class C family)